MPSASRLYSQSERSASALLSHPLPPVTSDWWVTAACWASGIACPGPGPHLPVPPGALQPRSGFWVGQASRQAVGLMATTIPRPPRALRKEHWCLCLGAPPEALPCQGRHYPHWQSHHPLSLPDHTAPPSCPSQDQARATVTRDPFSRVGLLLVLSQVPQPPLQEEALTAGGVLLQAPQLLPGDVCCDRLGRWPF